MIFACDTPQTLQVRPVRFSAKEYDLNRFRSQLYNSVEIVLQELEKQAERRPCKATGGYTFVEREAKCTLPLVPLRMKDAEMIQVQNEIFTTYVIEELSRQRDAGKKKGEFLLDKYAVDIEVKERFKKFLSGEKNATNNSDLLR